jgi:outer membrane protein OmpA-like peptidoglycan-associated protein
MRLTLCALCIAALGGAPAWGLDAQDIKPRQGLVLTTTTYASVVVSGAGLGYMDTEDHFRLSSVAPEGLTYQIRVSIPGNAQAEEVKRLVWPRQVRHEDLEESSRLTLLYSSVDPESYGGQTFAETSRNVLSTLKSSGESPFVVGIYAESDAGPLAGLMRSDTPAPPAPRPNGAPPIPDMGQLFHMMFGSARHYYRGTLKRLEPQDVPIAVLVNGARVSLPAVHAGGTFTFGQDRPQKVEMWWLDNADWPLTLRWTFGPASQLITRIDWIEETSGGGASGSSGTDGARAGMAAQLASQSCRVELHGIYFNSGSAVLLEESEPMLKQVAALIKASPEPTLSVEGHTDNIGSADYNQKLSEQRAAAVRDALVSRHGIPAARLIVKGYGLTRPVETNATFEGRARNRRVELARPCAAH